MNQTRLLNLLLVAAMFLSTGVLPPLATRATAQPDTLPSAPEVTASLAMPEVDSDASVNYTASNAPVPDIDEVPSSPPTSRLDRDWGQLPLYFVENQGQMDERVLYYIQGSDKTLYFTSDGVTFALTKQVSADDDIPFSMSAEHDPRSKFQIPNSKIERWSVKLDFVGANPNVHPIGEAKTEAVISYFKGSPDEWKAGLPTYSRIVYHDLWPGIDLVYYGTVNQLKYEFIVQPGADPTQIRLAYRGATSVQVNGDGQLEVTTPVGDFRDDTPVAYQEINAQRVPVSMAYVIDESESDSVIRSQRATTNKEKSYAFIVGHYDSTRRLVLDPAILVYCGYIGGAAFDKGYAIAVDNAGNAYITGYTWSSEATFPVTVGPDLTHNGAIFPEPSDVYVAKVNATGSALLYAGYIGGSRDDYGTSIGVDAAGNAYITGFTRSSQVSFPVTIGPDLTHNGGTCGDPSYTYPCYDAFVAKVNPIGSALVYAGYIGGSGDDVGNDIAVDTGGNAYVTGYTLSSEASFPVTIGPDLTYNGSYDVFVAKINPGGAALVYAGYIGGSPDIIGPWDITGGEDFGYGIVVDSAGSAYVTGHTNSPEGGLFPVIGGPDLTYNGGGDAFVAKIDPTGAAFVYAGYIGGMTEEDHYGGDIALDSAGNVYITGDTQYNSVENPFPVTVGPDLTYNGFHDAFVAKVNPAGTALIYAGYLGGESSDFGQDIVVDSAGYAYVTGYTFSNEGTFPVIGGPDLTYNGAGDAFVVKVNQSGSALIYAGYIGGSGEDEGYGIAVDSARNAYVTGYAESTEDSFPVTVGPDQTHNGIYDAFVTKININCDQSLNAGRNYRLNFHQLTGLTIGYTQTIAALQQQQSLNLLNDADHCFRWLAAVEPGNSLILTKLFDTHWEIATAHLLSGNDLTVEALDIETTNPGNPLSLEIDQLNNAIDQFTQATTSYTGLLASEYYTTFMTLQPTRIDPLTGQTTPYLDIQRLAQASAQKSRAYVEKAERQFRLFTTASKADAMQTLRQGMSAAVSEAALLRTLWDDIASDASYQAILRNIADMQRLFRYLQTGKNPFGYTSDHVPFHVDPGNLSDNNFEQTWALAHNELTVASSLVYDAQGIQQQIENSFIQLQQSLQTTMASYNTQLLQLCGPNATGQPDFEDCHQNPAGEIHGQLLRIDAARLRIDLVYQQMDNQLAQIDIEQQRAARVAGTQRATAQMILSTGEQLATLASEEAKVRQRSQRRSSYNYLGGILSGASGGLGIASAPVWPWGTTSGVILGAVTGWVTQLSGTSGNLGDLAAKRERLIAQQSAQVHYAEAQITDVNSEALIKQYMLRFTEYDIELTLADNNLQQELARLNGLKAQAEYLASEKAKAIAFNILLFQDPALRVLRDYTMELANDRFDIALRYAWEAGRALEYEANAELFDLDSLYRIRDINTLGVALAQMNTAYNDFRGGLPAPQLTTDHVFLSQALGFEDTYDPDLGRWVTREEKFNAYVRDRAHWVDLDGNGVKESLQFAFQTSILVGNRFFSTFVFNDKIYSLRARIYGNGLGDDQAAIRLTLDGTSFMRTANAQPILGVDDIREYNTTPRKARVVAVVNRDFTPQDAADFQLTSRSVAYTNWTLLLPKVGEPLLNSDINIDNIEDIQLDITHEAYTLQTLLRSQAKMGSAQPQIDLSLFEPPLNRPYQPIRLPFRLQLPFFHFPF